MKRRSNTMGMAMVFRGRSPRILSRTSPKISENNPKPIPRGYRDALSPLIGGNSLKLQSLHPPSESAKKGNSYPFWGAMASIIRVFAEFMRDLIRERARAGSLKGDRNDIDAKEC